MTTPVSGANSCVYDPALTPALDASVRCDPTSATCGPPAEPAATVPPSVVSDAEPGARQLVDRFDSGRRQSDCSLEAKNAGLACAKMTITAAGALAGSGTVVLGALGLARTFLDAVSCGKELRAYYDCKTE
jgi:hypothetical protein